MKKTLLVNLFSGPGAGKSTFCAGIFAQLKWRDIDCEMALEWAKDMVWNETENILKNQLFVFGQQQNRIYRLNGKVDVIITDGPLALATIYDSEQDPILRKMIFKESEKYDNMDIFLERVKPYNPKGRIHTEEQAKKIDIEIKDMLDRIGSDYDVVKAEPINIESIIYKILKRLEK